MSEAMIHLGYEIGTGEPVAVPLRHMAVTGQTQESGKTTTLEALISRSGFRALAFVTKREEGSFGSGRRIQPYFRDDAGGRPYWEFVESIVASTMGQKMKFERAWIMKAARGSHSLAEVRENLTRLQSAAKRSMDQDMFMLLAAYLDIVLPQLAHLPAPAPLDLQRGLNVMDVTAFSEEMQMLIVRSSVLWVHQHERDVVTIVPEAWKFIPESRMTPVKPSAERLIREGAGLHNFVWMDSQDIAGVWKLMLRAAAVWIIGVQREANEIKRTLSNIPASFKKPKGDAVATLGRGEFFACFGKEVRRVYVQPVWVTDDEARAIAKGHAHPHARPRQQEEKKVMAYDQVKADLQRENLELRQTVEKLQHQLEEAQAIRGRSATPASSTTPIAVDEEAMYQRFKKRITEEAPALLRLVVAKPEIEVHVQRQTLKMDTDTLDGRVAVLIADGFFNSPKTPAQTLDELARRGWRSIHPRLSESFSRVTKRGFLYKEDNGYVAVAGMKVHIVEAA
jgi:hypothetical protein